MLLFLARDLRLAPSVDHAPDHRPRKLGRWTSCRQDRARASWTWKINLIQGEQRDRSYGTEHHVCGRQQGQGVGDAPTAKVCAESASKIGPCSPIPRLGDDAEIPITAAIWPYKMWSNRSVVSMGHRTAQSFITNCMAEAPQCDRPSPPDTYVLARSRGWLGGTTK